MLYYRNQDSIYKILYKRLFLQKTRKNLIELRDGTCLFTGISCSKKNNLNIRNVLSLCERFKKRTCCCFLSSKKYDIITSKHSTRRSSARNVSAALKRLSAIRKLTIRIIEHLYNRHAGFVPTSAPSIFYVHTHTDA